MVKPVGTNPLILKRNTHQNGILIKMEHSYYYQKWNTHIIKMEYSSKRNTHIKMEYSSKWNTHQKWNSLNRNIHIIKKKGTLILIMEWEHSYQKDCRQPETIKEPSIRSCDLSCLSTWEGVPSSHTLHSTSPLWFCTLRSWFRMELSSSASHGLSNGTLLISKPWIIVKSLGSSFNDLLKTIKTIFNHITVSFSLTQGSPPPPDLDFGLCARVFSAVLPYLEPTIPFSHSPAVSPFKSRDFRLPEPAIPFYPWSAVVTSGEPAIPFFHLVRGFPPSRDE